MRVQQLVLSSLLVLTSMGVVGAQSAAPLPAKRFGIVGGINSSTVAGDDTEDASRRTGVIAGILLSVPVAPNFAIQPEFLYSMKGAKFADSDASGTVKIDYAEIPILVRVDVPASGGVKPFFYGGPALSFKISCKVEATVERVDASADCDEIAESDTKFKSVDYGLVVGGGLAFDLAGKTFTIGARYNHGLGKLFESSDRKNRVISLLATLEFPWGP